MIWFIVNDLETLSPKQTTAALIRGLAARGYRVGVCGVGAVSLEPDGRIRAPLFLQRGAASVEELRHTVPVPHWLEPGDQVWIRTNPGRYADPEVHRAMLAMLAVAQSQGISVINRPDGLQKAETKLYLHHLPAHVRPPTLVSGDPAALHRFVATCGEPVVLKPLSGTRGTDVFKVHAGASNLSQIIECLTRQGPTMAQGFVPEAVDGDVRVLLVKGQPLRVKGAIAAVRRRPPAGDFRSNVFRGGQAEGVQHIPGLDDIVAAIAPRLVEDGLFLVGLDLIGRCVVEVNVFSPGGLGDAQLFSGVDFETPLLDAFVAAVQLKG